jgi:hypothetical protein
MGPLSKIWDSGSVALKNTREVAPTIDGPEMRSIRLQNSHRDKLATLQCSLDSVEMANSIVARLV